MIDTTSVADFALYNCNDVRAIIGSFLKGPQFLEDRRDAFQTFFMTAEQVLGRYDASRSQLSTYIFGCVSNQVKTIYEAINKEKWRLQKFSECQEHDPNIISQDTKERILKFKDYIQKCGTRADMEYLKARVRGDKVKHMGQQAWNSYHTLLNNFLRAEKLAED